MAFRQSKDFVASLEKGLDVLTCFNRQNAKLTLSEVARLTGSSPASARRSLLTLHALDFLESDGRRFWLEPELARAICKGCGEPAHVVQRYPL